MIDTGRRASVLAAGVLCGDRRSIARALTLVESMRAQDRPDAEDLIAQIAPTARRALRVGITGVPGAGKSTVIDLLGCRAIASGRRVAVLAVDPSSDATGGSILGDKTRMTKLTTFEHSFIRPTPSKGVLGGLAESTHEAALICEAAGYDVLLFETVGIGQSEHRVTSVADLLIIVTSCDGGDELQWAKRGTLEYVDLVVVNKADLAGAQRAARVAAEVTGALRAFGRSGSNRAIPVLCVSALEDRGISELWQALLARRDALDATGELSVRRSFQIGEWLRGAASATLVRRFFDLPNVRALQA
jgi:LAO/AO transport system kinase